MEVFQVLVCFVFSPGAVQEGERGLLWAEETRQLKAGPSTDSACFLVSFKKKKILP